MLLWILFWIFFIFWALIGGGVNFNFAQLLEPGVF